MDKQNSTHNTVINLDADLKNLGAFTEGGHRYNRERKTAFNTMFGFC